MAESTATAVRGRRALGALREGVTAATRTPYGWAPAVVIFLVGLVDRIEYTLVPAVLPQLQEEWGFGDAVAGSIPTASAIAAGLLAVPAGYLADRYSRTRITAIVVFAWALATLGSGFATGLLVFYCLRVLLAAAEAIDNPATGSLLADYYPPATRATAFGWWRTSAYLGGLGLVIGGVLAELLGWRGVFVVMTVPGIAVAVLMWRLREPERGLVDRIAAGGTAPEAGAPPPARPALREQLRTVARIPTLWAMCGALTVMTLSIGALQYWFPSLMVRKFGVGEAAAGSITGGLSLVGVVGGVVLSTWLAKTPRGGLDLASWRVLLGGSGILVGALLMTGVLAAPGIPGVAVFLVSSTFFMSFAVPTLTACVADVIPARDRGAAFGLLQVGATIGGAIGPFAVGLLSEATGSLQTAMWPLVPLLLVGGVTALIARPWAGRDAAAVLDRARTSG